MVSKQKYILALLVLLCATFFADARGGKRALYKRIEPITMPENLPDIAGIAQAIIEPVGKENFLFGASSSEHQSSRQCTPEICSASRWALENSYELPTDIQYKMDFWNNYKNYIDDAINQLGIKAVRFSIEMALVQPDGPGSWDRLAIKHYEDLFTYCLKKGITPLITFHHYTDPSWFVDKGGFEKIDNVFYFEQQCVKLYASLIDATSRDMFALIGLKNMYPREPLWITFNAPEAYAFRGYYAESGPPSHPYKKGLMEVAEVIKNCCEATVRVSKALKASFASKHLPSVIHEPKVGLLKNIHQVDPARGSLGQKIRSSVTRFMIGYADLIRNDAMFDFFTTGIFSVKVPFGKIKHSNKDAIGCLDFVGLNYYSNRYLSLASSIAITDPILTTDSDYYHYPQGIYRAIIQMYQQFIWPYEKATNSKLPLFIAENGIATNNHEKRSHFYHAYLYAISCAVQEGYPIYGYTPWALFDNYEWPTKEKGAKRNYGIFSISNNGNHLELKQGSWPLKEFAQAL